MVWYLAEMSALQTECKELQTERWDRRHTVTELPALGVELPDDVAHDDYHGPLLVAGAECAAEGSASNLPLPARVILSLSLDNSLTFNIAK